MKILIEDIRSQKSYAIEQAPDELVDELSKGYENPDPKYVIKTAKSSFAFVDKWLADNNAQPVKETEWSPHLRAKDFDFHFEIKENIGVIRMQSSLTIGTLNPQFFFRKNSEWIDIVAEENDREGTLIGVSFNDDATFNLIFDHAILTFDQNKDSIRGRTIFRIDEQ